MKTSALFKVSLFLFAFALTAHAKFYPYSSTGPAGDEMGKKTRTAITEAIAQANRLDAILGATNPDAWPEALRDYCGTQAAQDARMAVLEVRAAFEQLRDNWDRLSVETVSLKKGWNASYVYVEDPMPPAAVFKPSEYPARLRARVARDFVDPSAYAVSGLLDEIAGLARALVEVRQAIVGSYITGLSYDWPVEDVYIYMSSTDAAAQFSTDVSSEASASTPYLTWSVAAPDALNVTTLPAGRVYTTFSTSTTTRVVAFLGCNTHSGAMTWHKTGGSDNPAEWNFLGIASTLSRTSAEKVMKDLDFTSTECAKLKGTDPAKPEFERATAGVGLMVADGDVLIADASAASSWYPAPTVRPADGVTIAAGKTEATFTLANDTAIAQTVTGTLHRTGMLKTALWGVTGLDVCRTSGGAWWHWNFTENRLVSTNLYFVDTLAAGESRTYTLHFDRTAFDIAARENGYSDDFDRTFAAVLRFRYGSNTACTHFSVVAAPDNDKVASIWPAGLWTGTMYFDKVSQVKGNQTIVHDVPAKGMLPVRAILHVDAQGGCRLLHHVVSESVTSSNAVDGVFVQTTLYVGNAKPTGEGDIKRLDSIAMDIDNPVVEGTGGFTNGMSFAWTMKPDGRGNPFHHPYHPDHDGLQWDFKTPAPNGDDMNNYRQGAVKPETWSIDNKVTITLLIDKEMIRSLSDEVTGTCTWELGNLRRKVNGENIRASGTISLQRIESVGKLVTE